MLKLVPDLISKNSFLRVDITGTWYSTSLSLQTDKVHVAENWDNFYLQNDGPRYSDINMLLDQILNITDQSLDEAQVSGEF
jgi:hypothetical protein